MFLEVHQPVGQLQIVDVEQLAAALERGRIFAVRVDHHDVTLGRELRNAMQDQRDRGRLTGTGRSQHREMLRQHRVDVERAADVVGRIDGADLDMRVVGGGENGAHVLGGDRQHFAARDRIARDAAAEVGHPAAGGASGPRRGSRSGRGSCRRFRSAACGRWRSASSLPTIILTWLPTCPDMATDGSAWLGQHLQPLEVHPDPRAGAGDFQHPADRRDGCLSGRGGRGLIRVAVTAQFVEELLQARLIGHRARHPTQ